MSKRRVGKSPKTDIFDAVVQDVELTVEQVEDAAEEAAKAAGRALSEVVKPKDVEPGSAPLVEDPRFKIPRP
jgi:hypothetical protein